MQKINRRFEPSPSDSDYYMLTQLRSALENVIKKYIKNSEDNNQISILDYGCGEVPYSKLFATIPHKFTSADLPGNELANMILDANGNVPCEDESFDVVLSIQVLEHVPSPQKYLSEALRVLKHNGLLLLSTHGWWTHHPYPNDYWRWTREGLEKILNEEGFKVVDNRGIIGMLAYSYQLRAQCWKGLLENKGLIASSVFSLIAFYYQKCMHFADIITPVNISKNNSSIYLIVAKKA
ncbi:class I SAM-dependent methyltransferase [Geobacter benzoatilyticus]|uniref:Class I SAM-dependent methyltransferase n=1 Tax=Geobacter benzoatilyticus TaxID=2815309 RepID=A0ABX7Q1Q7_9BACT|nr:class I SAM-dependent methyltransferase [Geobacter benzoatilyticus]QSV45038.1 class I SAM-dependent methyltransferase [Geobacter benzoatilyticus]